MEAERVIPLYVYRSAEDFYRVHDGPDTVERLGDSRGEADDSGKTRIVRDAAGRVVSTVAFHTDANHFWLGARLAAELPPGRYSLETTLETEPRSCMQIGWQYGQYSYSRFRSGSKKHPQRILQPPCGVNDRQTKLEAAGLALVRDLVNCPPNHSGPAELSEYAQQVGEACTADVTVLNADELLERNLSLIHGVGRALSVVARRFLRMERSRPAGSPDRCRAPRPPSRPGHDCRPLSEIVCGPSATG